VDLVCKWCLETKPEDLFIKRERAKPYSQSNVRCCRQCQSAYQKRRYGEPKLRVKQLKANSAWRKKHPDAMARYQKKLNEERPNQQRARNRIAHLLRRGQLIKQPCERCGAVNTQAHHDSYARPHWDSVRWLCQAHHEQWHQRLDPLRDLITKEPFCEVRQLRQKSKHIQAKITALREQFRDIVAKADSLELATWDQVTKRAKPLYVNFLRVSSGKG
jgi:hypothetical protein